MKKAVLFLLPLLLPFLLSAGAAERVAATPEALVAAIQAGMRAGSRSFSVRADFPLRAYRSPAALMDAVYCFDDTDTKNDRDDLRESIACAGARIAGNRCSFFFLYLTTPEQDAYVGRRAAAVLSALSLDALGEAERARAVVDWVCQNVSYDGNERTAYAGLRFGGTNCVGYSVLTFKLLRGAGLDAKIVNGLDSGRRRHAWNLVKIDGAWYNLDVTWGDTGGTDRWFFCGTERFTGHDRYPEYCTARFERLYTISSKDLDTVLLSYGG